MKKLFVVSLLLFVAVAGYSQSGKNFLDKNYIEVSGYNKTEVVPNMIFINFQISEADTKGKISVDQMQRNMIKSLEKIGVNISKQLNVSDMSSNFVKYALKKQSVLLSKDYILEVNSAQKAGEAFAALESVGVSNASIGRVDHSDMDNLRIDSKVEAVKAAKVKASAEAGAVDRKIGRAIFIQDLERSYRPYNGPVMFKAAASFDESGSGSPAPAIEFQKITMESNVTVYFELAD